MIRYNATIKAMLLDVFDYLAQQGHQEAVQAIKDRLRISEGELAEWLSNRAARGMTGLKATKRPKKINWLDSLSRKAITIIWLLVVPILLLTHPASANEHHGHHHHGHHACSHFNFHGFQHFHHISHFHHTEGPTESPPVEPAKAPVCPVTDTPCGIHFHHRTATQ